MSEHETPEVTPAAPPSEILTDDAKALVATLTQIAKSNDDVASKLEHATAVQEKLAEERKKSRQIETTAMAPPRDPKDIVGRPHYGDRDTKTIQQLNDAAVCKAMVRAVRARSVPAGGELDLSKIPPSFYEDIDEYRDAKHMIQKAAGSFWQSGGSSAGTGYEWVPTGFSNMFADFYTVDSAIPSLFQQVNIPDGVGDFTLPNVATAGYAILETEQSTIATTTGAFANSAIFLQDQSGATTFSPKKISNGAAITMEGVEDIIFDSVQRAVASSQRHVRRGVVEAIINGQTATDTTLDDAPSTSGFYAANGYSNAGGDNSLRLHCIVNAFTTPVGGALDIDDSLVSRAAMGAFGANPMELAWILSPKAYIQLLSDTSGNIRTVDQMGVGAPILTGQLASAGGCPVFMDSNFPANLDSGGINQAATASGITGAVMVNRTRWYFATKRNLNTVLLPQPGYDAMYVITRSRTHFAVGVADEHSAHYSINVT